MDGPTNNPARTPGQSPDQRELSHDEPVSLRPATSVESTVSVPNQNVETASFTSGAAVETEHVNDSDSVETEEADSFGTRADTSPQQSTPEEVELSWTASEFVAHDKSPMWYAGLAGVTVVIVALGYLITRDFLTVGVFLICAGLFAFSASRKPRQLEYAITNHGLHVGSKFYPFDEYRSFSVIDEGPFSSIDFMPLKRFAPMLSIYYDPQHENDVVALLSEHLAFANHKRTMTEDLMHRIRF